MIVRNIMQKDLEAVKRMDEESGRDVYSMIFDYEDDEQDYAYGIFTDKDILVGYCTAGCADVLEFDAIENPDDSMLLSDVFVDPAYRGRGYATEMIEEVVSRKDDYPIYLEPLTDDLIDFYEKIGFQCIDPDSGKPAFSYLMVYNPAK